MSDGAGYKIDLLIARLVALLPAHLEVFAVDAEFRLCGFSLSAEHHAAAFSSVAGVSAAGSAFGALTTTCRATNASLSLA